MYNYGLRYIYDVNSKAKFANGLFQVIIGIKHPQQMLYETYRDQIVKRILFR